MSSAPSQSLEEGRTRSRMRGISPVRPPAVRPPLGFGHDSVEIERSRRAAGDAVPDHLPDLRERAGAPGLMIFQEAQTLADHFRDALVAAARDKSVNEAPVMVGERDAWLARRRHPKSGLSVSHHLRHAARLQGSPRQGPGRKAARRYSGM